MAKLTEKLTDKEIRNAAPRPGVKITKLADGGGLFLWVQQNGTRLWRFRFVRDGKEKSLALGAYPDVSLKEARERAARARARLSEGGDPSADKRDAKRAALLASETAFEPIAREWIKVRGRRSDGRPWTPAHKAAVVRTLEEDVFPHLGVRAIATIKAPEILGVLRRIENRGAHEVASRVRQRIEAIFTFAIATGRAEDNPAVGLQKALTPPRKESLKALPTQEVPELMLRIEEYHGEEMTRLALKLLAYTFVRTNELRSAAWSEVDLEAARWVIPAERMKARREHVVPLSRQAIACFEQLQVLSGTDGLCFPSRNNERVAMSVNTVLYALYRLGYHGRHTGHGFRSVASTILNELGFRGDVIEAQLAHIERDATRAAYNRAAYMKERADMMQAWADHLDGLREIARKERTA